LSKVLRVKGLRELVFKHFGLEFFEEPLDKTTTPEIWAFLNNEKHVQDTPVWRMNHNRLKLPEEHLSKIIDLKELKRIVLKQSDVETFFERNPREKKKFDEYFNEAVFWHAIKSPYYWRESTSKDSKYHSLIASAAEGVPLEMNRFAARKSAEFIRKRIDSGKPVTVMDVGVGGGNTIRFLLQELRNVGVKNAGNLKIVLNDVEPSVFEVAKKLASEFSSLSLTEKNFVCIPTTFYAVSQVLGIKGMPKHHPWKLADENVVKVIKGLKKNVDLLVSGASFNNLPHSKLAFSTVNALLKNKGKAVIWDWGGFDVTQKIFSQKQLDRKIKTIHPNESRRVTVRENIKGFWRFWLEHHGYTSAEEKDDKAWRMLEHYIDSSEKVDVYSWFNEHVEELEALRRGRAFTYFGHANRAYRTPEDVIKVARRTGFKINQVSFPLADRSGTEDGKIVWSEENPRFVTWFAELTKTRPAVLKKTVYIISDLLAKFKHSFNMNFA